MNPFPTQSVQPDRVFVWATLEQIFDYFIDLALMLQNPQNNVGGKGDIGKLWCKFFVDKSNDVFCFFGMQQQRNQCLQRSLAGKMSVLHDIWKKVFTLGLEWFRLFLSFAKPGDRLIFRILCIHNG
jgi:hypothetical protein